MNVSTLSFNNLITKCRIFIFNGIFYIKLFVTLKIVKTELAEGARVVEKLGAVVEISTISTMASPGLCTDHAPTILNISPAEVGMALLPNISIHK